MSDRVRIWGLPLAPLRRGEVVDAITALIEAGKPSFFVTANLHYAMLCDSHARLGEVNERAALVVADGAPLVWASRLRGTPVPERVAGSDLIFDLCERAAARGHRVFFLGGAPGVGEEAARRLTARFPGLQVVGTIAPPFRELTAAEHEELLAQIRAARPDLLMVAFGQPKGEYWLLENLDRLGVPVGVQLGASIDFAAGRVSRAPRWVQKIGMEWFYRMSLEPARLGPRYARNALFLGRMTLRDLAEMAVRRPGPRGEARSVPPLVETEG